MKIDSGQKEKIAPPDELRIEGWVWKLGQNGEHLQTKSIENYWRQVFPQDTWPKILKREQFGNFFSNLRKRGVLGKLIEEAKGGVMIELCLRLNMICEPLDQDKIQVGPNSQKDLEKFGVRYPVVMRSFERIYADEWNSREYWSPKWDALRNRCKDNEVINKKKKIHLICDEHKNGNLGELIRNENVLGAALEIVPDAELISTCINAGAPVILWLRESKDLTNPRGELECLLDGVLYELPQRIRDKRAQYKTNSIGEHLALIWDDIDRLPPDAEDFAAPGED